jgi:phosphatidylcholine synthase
MWAAAFVHVFTASGILCALAATLCVLQGAWIAMFVWLGVALVIDGIDGTLARAADVEERLPRFSGERLDLVIDYITYVFVPVVALLQAGFLQGTMGMLLACSILVSSLYHFADTESKAEDSSFVGFPAIWNAVAFHAFALGLPPAATAIGVVVLVVLTFIPLKWAHPLRTPFARPLSLAVAAIWATGCLWVLWTGFPASGPLQALLLACIAYAAGLTAYLGKAR